MKDRNRIRAFDSLMPWIDFFYARIEHGSGAITARFDGDAVSAVSYATFPDGGMQYLKGGTGAEP